MSKGLLFLATMLALATGVPASVASTQHTGSPDWIGNPRLDGAGQFAAGLVSGQLNNSTFQRADGTPCAAEASASGNVQVNCRAEDGTSPLNTQNETSVAAFGQKVVVAFNDSLVCCRPVFDGQGYSVSTDGGSSFTDMGNLPAAPGALPISDPAIANDDAGNFYVSSLALSADSVNANCPFSCSHSEIAFYEMPAGSNTFRLVSVPVDVGSAERFFADKGYLAVGRDGAGQLHFYITWTLFSQALASPIMLTDSTDGVHWRTTTVSAPDACAQGSTPLPAGAEVHVSWTETTPSACAAGDEPSNQMMATLDVASGTVERVTTVAPVKGSGDKYAACGSDMRQVIETEAGHDARATFELPSISADANGTLYMVWNDRPNGVGGSNANATRIYLSYSRDGNRTWTVPQVISPTPSTANMNDRFQPWIAADASGLHVMWYARIKGTPADLIRTDKEDLTLASATKAPRAGAETVLSTVAFPVIHTNPNQDPVMPACYMGDYNNIVSNGTARFVTWGDNRNVVTTSSGTTEHQPDVFLAKY
jgi:hypothetical protein